MMSGHTVHETMMMSSASRSLNGALITQLWFIYQKRRKKKKKDHGPNMILFTWLHKMTKWSLIYPSQPEAQEECESRWEISVQFGTPCRVLCSKHKTRRLDNSSLDVYSSLGLKPTCFSDNNDATFPSKLFFFFPSFLCNSEYYHRLKNLFSVPVRLYI